VAAQWKVGAGAGLCFDSGPDRLDQRLRAEQFLLIGALAYFAVRLFRD
jgi:hypothetical protein